MARRKGRILAFQGMFSWDMGNIPVDHLITFPWVEGKEGELSQSNIESADFARLLILGTVENISQVDSLIKKHLDSWDFERVNKVDLAILRISVYSLLYQRDIHPTIVINEAIDISKEFGSADSFKFVNGILDNIKKEIGR